MFKTLSVYDSAPPGSVNHSRFLVELMVTRVVFVTQDEPMYLPLYLDRILSMLPASVTTARVLVLPLKLPRMGHLQTYLYFIFEYYGVLLSCYLAILKLWFSLKDITRSRSDRLSRLHSIEAVCRRHGVGFESVSNINDPDLVRSLRDERVDILFSIASSQIFKEPLLTAPRKGCLNIHSALLPAYRGFNANFWVLAKGERKTGVTVHRMTSAIDGGAILLQRELEISDGCTLNELYLQVVEIGSTMAVDCIQRLDELDQQSVCQNLGEGGYYSLPRRADVKEFRKRGRRFFRYY